jgi:hypothetical protein
VSLVWGISCSRWDGLQRSLIVFKYLIGVADYLQATGLAVND